MLSLRYAALRLADFLVDSRTDYLAVSFGSVSCMTIFVYFTLVLLSEGAT